MILTEQEKREIVGNFNLNVGNWNSNGLMVANAIEATVLEKLADKLLDADRCYWLLEHAYVAASFTDDGVILEIAGTDRTVPARATQGQIGVKPYTAREGIDAAMLASKAGKP